MTKKPAFRRGFLCVILAISAGPCYNVSNYGEEEKEYARQASPGG